MTMVVRICQDPASDSSCWRANLPGTLWTGDLKWVAVVPLRGCIYCTFYESNVVDRHSKDTKVNNKITDQVSPSDDWSKCKEFKFEAIQ